MDVFEAIRRDHFREELSIRALADRHHVHRRTVRAALESSTPPPRKQRASPAPKLDPVKPLIDAMLREDLEAPRKQRHTALRVFDRLVDEHGVREVSYSAVRAYVSRRRPEIWAEAGKATEEACVPQTHEPGAEAEVDFADVWLKVAGVLDKYFLFTLRLSYSGKAVHRVFASQGQEAFIEGHLIAFAVLGGTPVDKIRYDNLKSAVSRVLLGRNRTESERWVAFRSHYGFDTFYCQAGPEGAHEKGGVEGEGGRFRRNHFVPMPDVASLAELNARLEQIDADEDRRRITGRTLTVGHDFDLERPLLRPLPAEAFEAGLWLNPKVDRYSRVSVRQTHYSVPVRLIGRRVRVLLRASEVIAYDGRREVARHERCTIKGHSVLVLDHYLEVLLRKPGALPGATALVQARSAGTFTAEHEAFWAAARKAHGDADGTRALVEVLLLHRHMRAADVIAGLRAALAVGAVRADVVAVEARKAAADAAGQAAEAGQEPAVAAAEPSGVLSLTQRRLADPAAVIAGLPADTRPLPSTAAYDDLLPRRRRAGEAAPTASSTEEVS